MFPHTTRLRGQCFRYSGGQLAAFSQAFCRSKKRLKPSQQVSEGLSCRKTRPGMAHTTPACVCARHDRDSVQRNNNRNSLAR